MRKALDLVSVFLFLAYMAGMLSFPSFFKSYTPHIVMLFVAATLLVLRFVIRKKDDES